MQKQPPEVFCKKSVHRNIAKFRPQACNFIKNVTLAQVIFCEFCQISKDTFFYRTPPAAASVHFTKYGLIQLGNPYINFEKPRETRRPAKELSPKLCF